MPMKRLALPIFISIALAGCGGGGGGSADATVPRDTTSGTDTTTTATPQEQFPTGVAITSPTEVVASASVAQVTAVPARKQLVDVWNEVKGAVVAGDMGRLMRVAGAVFPLPRAQAAPSKLPEFAHKEAVISAILAGTENPGNHIVWDHFFTTYNNANCFGPRVEFTNHDNWTVTDTMADTDVLPSGDLGMWTATSDDGRPCSVAQLNTLMRSRKERAVQGMVVAAAMRNVVRANALRMPASGSSLDIASHLRPLVQAAKPQGEVNAAVISRDAEAVTYRIRATDPTFAGGNGAVVEVLMRHAPGSSSDNHSGILTITVSTAINNPGIGCDDEMQGSNHKVSWIQTVRYERSGNDIHFSGREARYCGHGDRTQDNLAATIAALTSNGELDPAVGITGPSRGASKGWKGNFNRFAGTLNRQTHAGNFAYAWQAGAGDSHSRMFAVSTSYNTVSELRTAKAFYGYAGPIGTTNGTMLGMICNWAGPGNLHTPNTKFQSQVVTLATNDAEWTLNPVDSKIRYAPTNSCNSSPTMDFDQDGSGGAAAPGEGSNFTNELDEKGGAAASVAAELTARGYAIPSLF